MPVGESLSPRSALRIEEATRRTTSRTPARYAGRSRQLRCPGRALGGPERGGTTRGGTTPTFVPRQAEYHHGHSAGGPGPLVCASRSSLRRARRSTASGITAICAVSSQASSTGSRTSTIRRRRGNRAERVRGRTNAHEPGGHARADPRVARPNRLREGAGEAPGAAVKVCGAGELSRRHSPPVRLARPHASRRHHDNAEARDATSVP